MKTKLLISLVLILCAIKTYAGTGYYVTICNFANNPIKIEYSHSDSWQPGDLEKTHLIAPGDTAKLYTEGLYQYAGRVIINAYEVLPQSKSSYLGSAEIWQNTYPTIASYNISNDQNPIFLNSNRPHESNVGTTSKWMLTSLYQNKEGAYATAYLYLIFIPRS